MDGIQKITCEDDMMMLNVNEADAAGLPNTLAALAGCGVVVDMISQTAPQGGKIRFSFTAPHRYFDDAMKAVKTISSGGFSPPMISGGFSKLYLYGPDMVEGVGVAARALSALHGAGVEIYMITTSDLDISILVRAEDADVALAKLKDTFGV